MKKERYKWFAYALIGMILTVLVVAILNRSTPEENNKRWVDTVVVATNY